MSAEEVSRAPRKAATEPAFRTQVAGRKSKADQALDGDDLTPAETAMVRSSPKAPSEAWQRPTFKELGAAVLSVVLVLICVPVIVTVIGQIDSQPIGVKVGEATVIVDGYDRAKQLLGIVFPLLTATITFWLGVAVEGRRADANGKAADDATDQRDAAHEQRDDATRRERSARAAALTAITEIENALGTPTSRAGSGTTEYRGGPPPSAPAVDVDHLRGVISAAKTRLLD